MRISNTSAGHTIRCYRFLRLVSGWMTLLPMMLLLVADNVVVMVEAFYHQPSSSSSSSLRRAMMIRQNHRQNHRHPQPLLHVTTNRENHFELYPSFDNDSDNDNGGFNIQQHQRRRRRDNSRGSDYDLSNPSFPASAASPPPSMNFERSRRRGLNNNGRRVENEMLAIEKDVIGTTNAKLDVQRVVQVIDEVSQPTLGRDPVEVANTAHPWQLGVAAATTASIATYFVFNTNWYISVMTFVGIFWFAIGDPNEQDGPVGPLSRIVGRETIKGVEQSKPKLRAVVQAAIQNTDNNEETIGSLRQEIVRLQKENAQLRLWKEKRIATEMLARNEKQYSENELQELEHRLPSMVFKPPTRRSSTSSSSENDDDYFWRKVDEGEEKDNTTDNRRY